MLWPQGSKCMSCSPRLDWIQNSLWLVSTLIIISAIFFYFQLALWGGCCRICSSRSKRRTIFDSPSYNFQTCIRKVPGQVCSQDFHLLMCKTEVIQRLPWKCASKTTVIQRLPWKQANTYVLGHSSWCVCDHLPSLQSFLVQLQQGQLPTATVLWHGLDWTPTVPVT